MDFFEVIKKRASYRGEFEKEKIPRGDLKAIVEAGIRAPSGYNFQTTYFIVVEDEDLKKKLAEIMPTPAMKTAAAIIIPLSTYHEADNGLAFEVEDYAAATENILLAIAAKGYAAVWTDGQTKKDEVRNQVAKILKIDDNKTVRALIPVGKPKEKVEQREKKALEERVKFL